MFVLILGKCEHCQTGIHKLTVYVMKNDEEINLCEDCLNLFIADESEYCTGCDRMLNYDGTCDYCGK